MPIETHTELINTLIQRCGYMSYLEIGVQYAERNFDLIECDHKHGVDICVGVRCTHHMSSDEFWARTDETYDLIFVDGDHRAFPALRDIVHAVSRLNPGGTVVVDNINPTTHGETRLDFSGTTWKAWSILRMSRLDLWMLAIDHEVGWGLIRPGYQELFAPQESTAGHPCYFGEHWDLTWEYLERFRPELLNLVSLEEFGEEILPTL
jgi:hypothetical protein